MILIESADWRLWSDPEVGVQWLAAQVNQNGRWVDVVPNCLPLEQQPSAKDYETAAGQCADSLLPAASFHMIPYSNRIRNGHFTFEGNEIQLEEAAKHSIHGALRKLPWTLLNANSHSMLCHFDSREHKPINWPWPISATIEQEIKGTTLASHISITNHGTSNMPVGTGWHPYFVRQIQGSHPTLTLPVASLFPDANGDCLPDGAAGPLPDALDFRNATQLNPDQRIDCCLAGLSGPCHIHWQSAGIELIMRASDLCEYLVLYNPDKPHFAIEPVSNANDAFNLSSQGIDSGLRTLSSGDTFKVSMQLELVLHD